MSETVKTVPMPTKEVIEYLRWAIAAAEQEFRLSTDDTSDAKAASGWVDLIEAHLNNEV